MTQPTPGEQVQWLRRKAARCLQIEPEDVDPSVPLFDYGLDSVAAVEFAAAVEERLGLNIHGSFLIQHPSLDAILAAARNHSHGTMDTRELLLRDARLPAEIQPQDPQRRLPERAVLLTGATGFVGAFLLRSLMEHSSVRIYCLVRGDEDPAARLQASLLRYGVWQPDLASRITIVPGDLRAPRFGLCEVEWSRLCDRVDVVFHTGAAVNWVTPYAGLRDVNVAGTAETLRLACQGHAKPLHFVSSLSVCYTSQGPESLSETSDPLQYIDGIHLGYAQSKAVSEGLVREAAARGLPVTIHRPGLVTGDTGSGISNLGDVTSALIRGCIQMGSAPDANWLLDTCPVDVLADCIVRSSEAADPGPPGRPGPRVHHWTSGSPRCWQELVLWMNLYGHDVTLIPHEAWRHDLARAALRPDHPLHGLRSFFVTPRHTDGLTDAERFEKQHRSEVRADATHRRLRRLGRRLPDIDPALLDRYFASYAERGFLPPVPLARRHPRQHKFDRAFFAQLLGRELRAVDQLPMSTGDSIITELLSWYGGSRAGLYRYRLTPADGAAFTVVLKVKDGDVTTVEVGRRIVEFCIPGLGSAFAAHATCTGIRGAARREVGIYRQQDPRFTRHAQLVHGTGEDLENQEFQVALEDLDGCDILDAADPLALSPPRLEAAIHGMAAVHAIWFGREPDLLAQTWLGPVPDSSAMAAAGPLFVGLREHARPFLEPWVGPTVWKAQADWIHGVGTWWPELEALPRTLIHGDLNSRNIAIRKDTGSIRVCVYDWELATLSVPQRDLAELLCFALTPDSSDEEIHYYVELHRDALQRSLGGSLDRQAWNRGFQLAMRDLLVTRLPLYCLVHRLCPRPFLERVARTWRRLASSPERPVAEKALDTEEYWFPKLRWCAREDSNL